MFQKQELQKMTVVQLRALAKENQIKLGSGVDKAGIIEKLCVQENVPEQPAPQPEQPSVEENPSSAESLSPVADVTVIGPARSSGNETENRGGFRQPAYRPSWQDRAALPRENAPRPAWQTRTVGGANRFGPQARTQAPEQNAARPAAPRADTAPRLDGYKLGYQAQPQRGWQNRSERTPRAADPLRSVSRPGEAYTSPFSNQNLNENGSVYQVQRDPSFERPSADGYLPEMMKLAPEEPACGMLEVLTDGSGLLHGKNLPETEETVSVSAAQIRRFGLRTGDLVQGTARRMREAERYPALLQVQHVNGKAPDEDPKRLNFDALTAVYPDTRVVLKDPDKKSYAMRLIDLVAPMGFGQRAMIYCPPACGRLRVLRDLARSLHDSDPSAEILTLALDANPEDLTELREDNPGEVFSCTFGEAPEKQMHLADLLLQRARRLAEDGRRAVLLLDSMNKLVKASQALNLLNNRPVINTITPAALVKPKALFASARNFREGGSLTVISTMAVESGNRVDEILFEEFKDAANMELWLCAPQEGDPVFPMPDLQKSGTRKADMLLTKAQQNGLEGIRKVLSSVSNREAVGQLLDMISKTRTNADLLDRLQELVKLWQMSR